MRHRTNPLEELGRKYGATKINHNYLQHYWTHLRDRRDEIRNVCEIGVQTGGSLRMWKEFFPNATIHGLDIDPSCRRHEEDRIRIHIGDQSDAAFLAQVVASIDGKFDLAIDDGSHKVEYQIASFDALFNQLDEHGIYVLEDTGGCVGDFNNTAIHHLSRFVDPIYFWPTGFSTSRWPELSRLPNDAPWAAKNVVGAAFYRWMVFLFRGDNPGDNPHLKR